MLKLKFNSFLPSEIIFSLTLGKPFYWKKYIFSTAWLWAGPKPLSSDFLSVNVCLPVNAHLTFLCKRSRKNAIWLQNGRLLVPSVCNKNHWYCLATNHRRLQIITRQNSNRHKWTKCSIPSLTNKVKLEDRSQKKKIMFLHSKNKASRKGYKGEC